MKNSKGMIVLLVALAALTLVVVVGLFFFYPKEQAKVAAAPATTGPAAALATPGAPLPDAFDPVEWTRDPKTTALQTPASPANPDQGFTVTLPSEPKTPATTQALPPSPGAAFPGDTAKPSNVQSTPVKPDTAPSAAVAAKPAPAKAVKPAAKSARVGDYWIQVGSFKDRYQAENTAKSLETQGLKGTLTTATVNGAVVVRVRVGPYANAAEAGKFLAWLKPVKEFSSSYITKVTASHAP
jgi:cell division protein FtsN